VPMNTLNKNPIQKNRPTQEQLWPSRPKGFANGTVTRNGGPRVSNHDSSRYPDTSGVEGKNAKRRKLTAEPEVVNLLSPEHKYSRGPEKTSESSENADISLRTSAKKTTATHATMGEGLEILESELEATVDPNGSPKGVFETKNSNDPKVFADTLNKALESTTTGRIVNGRKLFRVTDHNDHLSADLEITNEEPTNLSPIIRRVSPTLADDINLKSPYFEKEEIETVRRRRLERPKQKQTTQDLQLVGKERVSSRHGKRDTSTTFDLMESPSLKREKSTSPENVSAKTYKRRNLDQSRALSPPSKEDRENQETARTSTSPSHPDLLLLSATDGDQDKDVERLDSPYAMYKSPMDIKHTKFNGGKTRGRLKGRHSPDSIFNSGNVDFSINKFVRGSQEALKSNDTRSLLLKWFPSEEQFSLIRDGDQINRMDVSINSTDVYFSNDSSKVCVKGRNHSWDNHSMFHAIEFTEVAEARRFVDMFKNHNVAKMKTQSRYAAFSIVRVLLTENSNELERVFSVYTSQIGKSKKQSPSHDDLDLQRMKSNQDRTMKLKDRLRDTEQNSELDYEIDLVSHSRHVESPPPKLRRSRDFTASEVKNPLNSDRLATLRTEIVPISSRRATRASTGSIRASLVESDYGKRFMTGGRSPSPMIDFNLGPAWDRPLLYPPQGPKRVSVDFQDLKRLRDGEFLNDNLIGFYLRYLQINADSSKIRGYPKIYFFNTFFYEKLTAKPAATNPTSSASRSINYTAVQKWTSKMDIFDYDYLVVPINEAAHWYVEIICNLPRLVAKSKDQDPIDLDDEPETVTGTPISDIVEGDVIIVNRPQDNKDHSTPPEMEIKKVSHIEISPEEKAAEEHTIAINPQEEEQIQTDNLAVKLSQTKMTDSGGENEASKDGIEDAAVPEEITQVPSSFSEQSPRPPKSKSKKKGRRSMAPSLRTYEASQTIIIALDSLGSAHGPASANLKHYLVAEARERKGLELDKGDIPAMTARGIPLQENFSDCGVYVWIYIARFLADPKRFVADILERRMRTEDWTDVEPSKTRAHVRELLLNLYDVQKMESGET
jgi:hypothetical protein